MPLDALALVLVAAALHTAWNLTLHRVPDRVAAMAVAGLVGGAVLLPATLVAPPRDVLPLVALSACFEAAYGLCLAAAYDRGTLALAYPIGRGTAPLLVTLGGWVLLSQRPAPLAAAGAVALALGLVLVATAGRHVGRLGAVGFALLTGLTIAAYSLVDARAVRQVAPAGYLGAVLVLQGLLLVGWVRGNPARLRRALLPGAQIAVGSVGAYLLILLAFQRAGAGRVATLREVSVLLGLLLVGGQPGGRLWIGAGLVVLGAVLTAW